MQGGEQHGDAGSDDAAAREGVQGDAAEMKEAAKIGIMIRITLFIRHFSRLAFYYIYIIAKGRLKSFQTAFLIDFLH